MSDPRSRQERIAALLAEAVDDGLYFPDKRLYWAGRILDELPASSSDELRAAAQEVLGAFYVSPGITTGRQAKAIDALRAALHASRLDADKEGEAG